MSRVSCSSDPIIEADTDTGIAIRNNHRSSCLAMGVLVGTHRNNHSIRLAPLDISNEHYRRLKSGNVT